jgi:subtilisin family serine protease
MARSRIGHGVALVVFAVLAVAPVIADASALGRAAASAGRIGPELLSAVQRGARVPVLVVFDAHVATHTRAAAADALLSALSPAEFSLRHRYRGLSALAGSVTAAGLDRLLERSEVLRVDLDRPVVLHLAEAVPLTELDVPHALGYTGSGVTVGVIDTGVDLGHADVGSAVVGEHCFCTTEGGAGCCLDDTTEASGAGSAQDEMGHGTWVIGVVTSDGVHAPPGGAPDASIVAVKIAGETEVGLDSDVIAGLDWIRSERPDVDVVSLSVGTVDLYSGVCDAADAVTMSYAAAISALRASGVLVVSASGNSGSGTLMPAPPCVAASLAVGATWDDTFASQTFSGCTDAPATVDSVTCWSNANAETDLMAPGGRITTARRLGTSQTVRGTSFAAPLVAACAAVLLEADPSLTPDELEASLLTSSSEVFDDTNGLGYPRLDCDAALTRAIPAIPTLARPARALLACGFVALGAVARLRWRSRCDRRH